MGSRKERIVSWIDKGANTSKIKGWSSVRTLQMDLCKWIQTLFACSNMSRCARTRGSRLKSFYCTVSSWQQTNRVWLHELTAVICCQTNWNNSQSCLHFRESYLSSTWHLPEYQTDKHHIGITEPTSDDITRDCTLTDWSLVVVHRVTSPAQWNVSPQPLCNGWAENNIYQAACARNSCSSTSPEQDLEVSRKRVVAATTNESNNLALICSAWNNVRTDWVSWTQILRVYRGQRQCRHRERQDYQEMSGARPKIRQKIAMGNKRGWRDTNNRTRNNQMKE